jgi:hypothetical protein
MNQDEAHLNSLSIAHYVVGAFMVLFSCMPLLHVAVGLSFIFGSGEMLSEAGETPPPFFGWMFFLIGLFFFIFAQAISISVIVSGRFLRKRKNYLFSFVLACVACLFVPFGTILGIFTIIVLSRDSVKAIYEDRKRPNSEYLKEEKQPL